MVDGFAIHDDQTARWTIKSKIDGALTECDYRLFNWHMLMMEYHDRSLFARLTYGLPRYIKLFFSNLPARYFKANWRYGLFFLYPLVFLLGMITTSFLACQIILPLIGLGGSLLVANLLMLALIMLQLKIFGERWHFFLMLDDWAFAYDMMHSKNQAFVDKVTEFSQLLEKAIDETDADEILISAHSFGAIFALSSLGQMLQRKGEAAKPIVLLTASSSLLKIAFSTHANWLRGGIKRVLAQKNIKWMEFFAINDPISFYKSKPDTALKLEAVNPIKLSRVRFQEALSKERFKRMLKNFFRIHRQIVLANDNRYFYDYFAYISFPLPVWDWLTKETRANYPITRDIKTLKEIRREAKKAKGK